MDLLGNLGNADQLTAARSEISVLRKLVAELKDEVKSLKLKNACLEAEVQMYRTEMDGKNQNETMEGIPNGQQNGTNALVDSPFFQSGNGVYCKYQAVILKDTHGLTNPLCLSIDPEETIICSGGADGVLLFFQWGAISSQGLLPEANRAEVSFSAPVIGISAAKNLAAASCMDGSIHVVWYSDRGGRLKIVAKASTPNRHSKFCKNVLWCKDLIVSAASDGDVHFHRVKTSGPLDEEATVIIEHWKSLHFGASVESACIYQNKLVIYTRETNFLVIVDLDNDFVKSTVSLTEGVVGGFTDHVGFAILDLKVHGKYLACATDANRHIIIDLEKEIIVRDLYGHQADAYSTPRLSWSANGQYLYCNTQHESKMIVYEVASGKIVEEIKKPHTRPIKDLCSALSSDMLVTNSFDRQTCIWFPDKN